MAINLRQLSATVLARRFTSTDQLVGAGTSTGIEHALQQRKLGDQNKQNFKDYKCSEYLNFNQFSYYNIEVLCYNTH